MRKPRNRQRLSAAPRDIELSYEELRYQWRRSLSDDLVRSLASDFIRGFKDECTEDAYKEYLRRWPTGGMATKPGSPKASRRNSHSRWA